MNIFIREGNLFAVQFSISQSSAAPSFLLPPTPSFPSLFNLILTKLLSDGLTRGIAEVGDFVFNGSTPNFDYKLHLEQPRVSPVVFRKTEPAKRPAFDRQPRRRLREGGNK